MWVLVYMKARAFTEFASWCVQWKNHSHNHTVPILGKLSQVLNLLVQGHMFQWCPSMLVMSSQSVLWCHQLWCTACPWTCRHHREKNILALNSCNRKHTKDSQKKLFQQANFITGSLKVSSVCTPTLKVFDSIALQLLKTTVTQWCRLVDKKTYLHIEGSYVLMVVRRLDLE